ncbi:protein mono-ADP-ribosyltransferase PARP12-like [Myiozetetes cayanensis]|uniref:protein mono-ADP-ribosyltransferase PARP12-like n=1 Tax=Myiozetetes cayanensis TaxID=478635 RepID=UPI0021606A5A|nr:protein mono-ADP-ribosyltransferase PARP12-like [Myiozetetes cayanensis]XP_050180096.1 protein mono-ADP-ribosyltransferase PARP12-like [Myiozetetes cayanensis]XP_050180097.1 protein mono-ADP-ribosyltransferase PARP12-like [Myiozetetes cayanensis]
MEYAWYWLDDSEEWIEYGKEHPDHCTASITSEFLENEYQADKKAVIVFSAGSQQYKINFADMVQTNLVFRTRRNVIRLPKHLLSEGGQDRSQNTTLSPSTYPPQWDQSALPETGFKLIQLSCDSQEYEKIKRLFEKTMRHYCINQIQRIQNPTLWEFFQLQKEKMKKVNKSESVDERLLFHGTNPSHVSAICEQNFDWRLCGTHGTMYGKGSYFARDADYSHEYCSARGGRYTMFVAQVLVGDFVQGNSEYCRPPARASNSNRLYDSCVDDPTDPSIFVIFEKQQIYPAYILEYSFEARCVVL